MNQTSSVRRALEANILKSYLFSFMNAFHLWMPIWILYLIDQRGLSLTEVTALETPFFLGQVLTEVPTGAIADRYGRKISLVLSSIFLAVALLAFGMATSFLLVLGSYLVWSVATTLRSGADAALLYDSLKALDREEEFSMIQGRQLALNWGAMLVAGLMGAPLAEATSLAVPVLVSAGIIAASTLVALSLHEPAIDRTGDRPSYWSTMTSGLRYTWTRKSVRWAVVFMAVAPVGFYASFMFVQPFLTGHGAAVASLGLFMVPLRAMNIAGNLGAHHLRERFGMWPVLWAAPVAAGVTGFAVAGWDSIYAFAFIPGLQLVGSVRQILLLDYLNRRISSEMRATVLSSANLMNSLGLAMLAPIFGAIADSYTLRGTYLAAGIASVVLLPAILLIWKRVDSRDLTPEPSLVRRHEG